MNCVTGGEALVFAGLGSCEIHTQELNFARSGKQTIFIFSQNQREGDLGCPASATATIAYDVG